MYTPGNRILNSQLTLTVPHIKQTEKNAVRKLTINLMKRASPVSNNNQQLDKL